MSGVSLHDDDRILQLLADRATEGLDGTDAATLHEWLALNPDFDADVMDRAAAVVALTGVLADETALPTPLRGRLFADAEAFFA